MKAILLALIGAGVSVLAFPPFGPGPLIVVGLALFFWAVRLATSRRHGLLIGSVYGLAFFGGLMWWLAELELIALILVPVQAAFHALFAWWMSRYKEFGSSQWVLVAVGGWALVELVRYHFPVGGLEWGAAGYALSDSVFTRLPAVTVGTSGLTVLVVLIAAVIASALSQRFEYRLMWSAFTLSAVLFISAFPLIDAWGHIDSAPVEVAIVQGSTPCPFEHCQPDERLRTYMQHLELTRTIPSGSVGLVVWPEGSTGSGNADPVHNREVGEAIAAEARRIGAWILVGGDRPVSQTHWINANVIISPEGEIVGEYRKQHGVPFGEYIPWRPVFEWIPALDQVPRDMIPGDGPVVFRTDSFSLGSVISFEGGFARYARQHRVEGANVMVVATNNASYGLSPAADQFIGMTRMRAVELGIPIVHGAVTGKSAIIDRFGGISSTTGLGTQELLFGTVAESASTPYTTIGDGLAYLAVLVGVSTWWRARPLVGSTDRAEEEE